nr:hypothetical protein [Clostridium cochlearium]
MYKRRNERIEELFCSSLYSIAISLATSILNSSNFPLASGTKILLRAIYRLLSLSCMLSFCNINYYMLGKLR